MRSSKSRSRGNKNRNNRPSGGNIINRVFDSSGPDGKVRGTPQQIIEKYNQLHRDAQLAGDRVNAENFAQHAEHYTRMLAEAMREVERAREEMEHANRERQAERDRERSVRQNRYNTEAYVSDAPAEPTEEDLTVDVYAAEVYSEQPSEDAFEIISDRFEEPMPVMELEDNAEPLFVAHEPAAAVASAPAEPRPQRRPRGPRKDQQGQSHKSEKQPAEGQGQRPPRTRRPRKPSTEAAE